MKKEVVRYFDRGRTVKVLIPFNLIYLSKEARYSRKLKSIFEFNLN